MLSALLHLPELIGRYLLIALVSVINLIIVSIGGWIQLLCLALPSMPTAPTQPATTWLGWLNWMLPVAPFLAALTAFVTLWAAFLVIRVALKWVKVL